LPDGFDDSRLEAALFHQPTTTVPLRKAPPDYAAIHEQLQKPHVTLQLLWEEYREANPDGYRYSRFCELYQRWRRKQDVVLRQQHKPGERMFVDWAGATIPIHNRSTGEITQAHCSWPRWVPVLTPMLRLLEARSWIAGFKSICTPWSSTAA
jgi:transposase